MKRLIILLPIIISACASPVKITEGARNIQVMQESNVTANTCTKLDPVNTTIEKVLPAQAVYDAAVWEARNKASAMGGRLINNSK